ncbi:hypothetical protein VaNZ11_006099 [Volvox africanus]|uniref:Uncharacterized protein n=1 Tax=Volvox africanus TaxID=51714 RepID=A0ABQ5S0C3_9CHLO|nr:hypothetical protein VaNZ11_006099 [Volvox africanus]
MRTSKTQIPRMQQQETSSKGPLGAVAPATTSRCTGLPTQGPPINSNARPTTSAVSGLSSTTRASPCTGLPKFTSICKVKSPLPKVKLPKDAAADEAAERSGPPSPNVITTSDLTSTGVSSEGSNLSSSSGSTPMPPAAVTVMEAAVLPLPPTPVASMPTFEVSHVAVPTLATGQTAFQPCMPADTFTAQPRCTPAKTATTAPEGLRREIADILSGPEGAQVLASVIANMKGGGGGASGSGSDGPGGSTVSGGGARPPSQRARIPLWVLAMVVLLLMIFALALCLALLVWELMTQRAIGYPTTWPSRSEL